MARRSFQDEIIDVSEGMEDDDEEYDSSGSKRGRYDGTQDISTMNTEPMWENSSGINLNGVPDSQLSYQLQWSQSYVSSSDEEGDSEIPDITFASSHERKRIYHELLEKCRGLDESIHTQQSSKLLKDNITAADALFQQMNASISQAYPGSGSSTCSNQSQPRGNATGLGSTASEVLLSCMHTKACTEMLFQKVRSLGVTTTVFNFEDFLDNLSNFCEDGGEYCEKVAVEQLVDVSYNVSRTVLPFASAYNGMGRAGFDESANTKKQVKPRLRRKQEEDDKTQTTQSEILNEKQKGREGPIDLEDEEGSGTPEALAKNIMRNLKATYRSEGEVPQSLLQVCHSDNVNDMVTRLFGAAFCVRDGHVGVSVGDGARQTELSSCLLLHPEKPPQKSSKSNEHHRTQVIASFPVTLLKMLAEQQQHDEQNQNEVL